MVSFQSIFVVLLLNIFCHTRILTLSLIDSKIMSNIVMSIKESVVPAGGSYCFSKLICHVSFENHLLISKRTRENH